MLASKGAQQIIHSAVRWANEPLTQKPAGPTTSMTPMAQTLSAIQRLDQVTRGDKALAGAVALDAVQGFEQFAKANVSVVSGPFDQAT